MEEKPKEEIVKIKEPLQEPELKQVDISAFKPEPFNIIKFCQTWLPRVFVGIMLLGVIWLFKAGVDLWFINTADTNCVWYRIIYRVVLYRRYSN